ncbi:hypothetical protein V5T82_16745 [Magnetovibrio sp. PR-2]|uniref:hypothetical protein n=1 Tax=Magnetovibrio sp. PR-2 TaxID=3120356 RepID=UPI002FCE4552
MGHHSRENPTEEFRIAADMFKADQRNLDAPHLFAGQPISAEMFRDWVNEYDIPEHCPEDIRVQFDVSRNLYIYSWYVYRFTSPAQAQAYATLELALRTRFEELGIKFNKRRDGLSVLLQKAIKKGFLRDGGFPHLKHTPIADSLDPNGVEYCQMLPKIISTFRNSFAHGGTTLLNLPPSLMALQATSAIIHQIYSTTED